MIVALDLLTSIRYLHRGFYPDQRISAAMPNITEGERVPLSTFTKKEFFVAERLFSSLEEVEGDFAQFTWSKARVDWFESIARQVEEAPFNDELRVGCFGQAEAASAWNALGCFGLREAASASQGHALAWNLAVCSPLGVGFFYRLRPGRCCLFVAKKSL